MQLLPLVFKPPLKPPRFKTQRFWRLRIWCVFFFFFFSSYPHLDSQSSVFQNKMSLARGGTLLFWTAGFGHPVFYYSCGSPRFPTAMEAPTHSDTLRHTELRKCMCHVLLAALFLGDFVSGKKGTGGSTAECNARRERLLLEMKAKGGSDFFYQMGQSFL